MDQRIINRNPVVSGSRLFRDDSVVYPFAVDDTAIPAPLFSFVFDERGPILCALLDVRDWRGEL